MLGLASYVKWASGNGPENAGALNEAHVFLAPGPTALYELASSDRTVAAAKRLIASGEDLDQKDEHLTALALALEKQDLGAVKRLLSLGAHTDTPVGYGDIPVALMPVMESDVETIRVLQRAGVDYSRLRYHGATAFDFAKQTGNGERLEVLKRKEVAL
jgi:ankyrin repeat protein